MALSEKCGSTDSLGHLFICLLVEPRHGDHKPGVLSDFCEHENSWNSVQPQRKFLTNKIVAV